MWMSDSKDVWVMSLTQMRHVLRMNSRVEPYELCHRCEHESGHTYEYGSCHTCHTWIRVTNMTRIHVWHDPYSYVWHDSWTWIRVTRSNTIVLYRTLSCCILWLVTWENMFYRVTHIIHDSWTWIWVTRYNTIVLYRTLSCCIMWLISHTMGWLRSVGSIYRSLLQNIVSFIGLFWKRDL